MQPTPRGCIVGFCRLFLQWLNVCNCSGTSEPPCPNLMLSGSALECQPPFDFQLIFISWHEPAKTQINGSQGLQLCNFPHSHGIDLMRPEGGCLATGSRRGSTRGGVFSLLWHPGFDTEVGLLVPCSLLQGERRCDSSSIRIIFKELGKLENFPGYLFSKFVLLNSALKEGLIKFLTSKINCFWWDTSSFLFPNDIKR